MKENWINKTRNENDSGFCLPVIEIISMHSFWLENIGDLLSLFFFGGYYSIVVKGLIIELNISRIYKWREKLNKHDDDDVNGKNTNERKKKKNDFETNIEKWMDAGTLLGKITKIDISTAAAAKKKSENLFPVQVI